MCVCVCVCVLLKLRLKEKSCDAKQTSSDAQKVPVIFTFLSHMLIFWVAKAQWHFKMWVRAALNMNFVSDLLLSENLWTGSAVGPTYSEATHWSRTHWQTHNFPRAVAFRHVANLLYFLQFGRPA
jgi:hypothetical protein